MTKRKSISKKVRFEVFKRDGFTCAYCGQRPPEAILEVDHIQAVSIGGSNAAYNLITSCLACNRGKSNTPLDNIPPKLLDDLEYKKEKETQLNEYRRFIEKMEARRRSDIDKVDAIYSAAFNGEWVLTDAFRNKNVKRFLAMLPLHEVEDAMRKACAKFFNDEEKSIKYFCGICWNKFDLRNNI